LKKKVEDDDANEIVFKIDALVECNYEGKDEFWPCIVRRVNDDGTYDLEYIGDFKWAGLQRFVDPELVQKRGEGEKKKKGEGVWHWDGMSVSEDDNWREESVDGSDDNDDEDSTEEKNKKSRIIFFQFDELEQLIKVTNGNVDICIAALTQLSIEHPTFSDVYKLSKAVEKVVKDDSFLLQKIEEEEANQKAKLGTSSSELLSEDMVLMNLLYANRRTRLHSILRVLTRIENASHICAWTKASNPEVFFFFLKCDKNNCDFSSLLLIYYD
jgi:hypothetical protein